MTCQKYQDKLSPYMDQVLSQEEKADIEKHLKTCSDCRQELADLQKTSNLIGNLPEIPLPTDFQENLHHQLMALKGKGKAGRFMGSIFGHRWAPLAMVAILMLIFYPIISSMMTNPWNSASPLDDAGTPAPGISESQNSVLMQDTSDTSDASEDTGASKASEDTEDTEAAEQEILQEESQSQENSESKEATEAGIRVNKYVAGNNGRQGAPKVERAEELPQNTEQDALSDQILMRKAVPEENPIDEGANIEEYARGSAESSLTESDPVDSSHGEMNMLMMAISLDQVLEHQVGQDQYQNFIDRLEKLPATNPDVLEVTKEVTSPEEPERYFILVSEGTTTQVISLIRELEESTEESISEETETIPLTFTIREN